MLHSIIFMSYSESRAYNLFKECQPEGLTTISYYLHSQLSCKLKLLWRFQKGGEPSFLKKKKKEKNYFLKRNKSWWQFNNCWGSSLSCAVVFKIVIPQDYLLIDCCYYGN